jgi:hypothetical protein
MFDYEQTKKLEKIFDRLLATSCSRYYRYFRHLDRGFCSQIDYKRGKRNAYIHP